MNTLKPALFLTLAVGLTACSQIRPVAREEIAANMIPISAVESRSQRVVALVQMLSKAGALSQSALETVKGHYDVYFIYYTASTVYLARGNMESYIAHVKLAEVELEAVERLLRESVFRESELQSNKEPETPKLEL